MTMVLIPVLILSGIGFAMASLLAVGRRVFAVDVDERQELLMDILPGANCGGCGYPGCSGYAAALVTGAAKPTACPPGGADLAQDIGKIMGVEVEDVPDMIALVACAGDAVHAPERARYLGIQTCAGAQAVAGGVKKCTHGCLGLGDCADACPFDAIVITQNRLAMVLPNRCTGCTQCVVACPRHMIKMVPRGDSVHVLCHNPEKAKKVKAVCDVGCTGCKLCAKQSKRLKVTGALAAVDPESQGEDIPQDVALACPQGSIFDSRFHSLSAWLTEPSAREAFAQQSEAWKVAEKERKLAAKKAKAAKNAKKTTPDESAEKGGPA
ncbi:MAG: RnfABCDGE type electron transport complex subunit B [Myxococcota bacterium]|nr:RnfABCDGE type electron transport complex subunit B [Myxococcota bacterium]